MKLAEKRYCTGCEVCNNVCPKEAIKMEKEEEGYYFPKIDFNRCIECGLCEIVCPVLNDKSERSYTSMYYGASSKDTEIILNSSSGGMFSEILNAAYREESRKINVAGVIYENDFKSVKHVLTSEIETINRMRGSKYIQSRKSNIYVEVKKKLFQGEFVIFTGTPCEVAALRKYLAKDYDNLLCLDFICKGGACEDILAGYTDYLEKKYKNRVIDMNMRYKWKNLDVWIPQFIRIEFRNGKQVVKEFYNTFLGHGFRILQRQACYNCKFRENNYKSDITIGDYHGASKKEISYNHLGTSVVIVNSEKGQKYLDLMRDRIVLEQISKEEMFHDNRNTIDKKRNTLSEAMKENPVIDAIRMQLSLKDKIKMVMPVGILRKSTTLYRKIRKK